MSATDPERLRAIAFESEYWLGLIAEMQGLNDGTAAVAQPLTEACVAFVTILTAPADRREAFVLDAMGHINEALRRLLELQEIQAAIGRLVDGRYAALSREVYGDDEHSVRVES